MSYQTNLTDSQWEVISKVIENKRKRKNSLRRIIDGILHVTKRGIQWRLLPKESPKGQLVYYYFRKWSGISWTEWLHDELMKKVRQKRGKQSSPLLGLVDAG